VKQRPEITRIEGRGWVRAGEWARGERRERTEREDIREGVWIRERLSFLQTSMPNPAYTSTNGCNLAF